MRLLLRTALGRPAFIVGACAALLLVESASAASFFVRTDRDMVLQASAIVVASALASHTDLSERGAIQTITTMSLEEVIKGSIDSDTFDVHEPGGVYRDRLSSIPGVPQFKEGERYILFLLKDDAGLWHALDLVLGKFTFRTDLKGVQVALRDVRDVRHGIPTDPRIMSKTGPPRDSSISCASPSRVDRPETTTWSPRSLWSTRQSPPRVESSNRLPPSRQRRTPTTGAPR